MNYPNKQHRYRWHFILLTCTLLLSVLAGCKGKKEQASTSGDGTSPDAALTEVFQAALMTAEAQVAAPVAATEIPAASDPAAAEAPAEGEAVAAVDPASIPTPVNATDAPAGFSTARLETDTLPQSYIANTCEYFYNRWGPNKSEPGTIVVPVMYHGIVADDKEITDNMFVHTSVHHEYMNTAKAYNFEAISMSQMVDFMLNNASIPKYSVINIVDDRHKKAYFNEFFYPYFDEFQWPVINAWISTPYSDEDLWQQQVEMNNEGWVDYQAHGVVHNVPVQDWAPDQTITTDVYGTLTADEYIFHEISDPVSIFQERFNKAPIAYIWPGGGFSAKAIEVAKQAGYEAGFTVFQRGPLMYNWVPLGAQERSVNAPMFVLPRYWSYAINYQLEEIIQISQEAEAFAQQNKQSELDWYNANCLNAPAIPLN